MKGKSRKRWIIFWIGTMSVLLSGCAVPEAPTSPGADPCALPSGVSPYSLEALAYRQQCVSSDVQQK